MTISFEDFNQRSEEVSKYFDFLQDLQQGKIKLITEIQGNSKAQKIDTELENTLKASAYLLLYNFIESTMKDAIEAIFNELQNQGISFDKIRPELKRILLRNLKRRDPDKIFAQIQDISLDIVQIGFKREELFSGNIDARLIRDIASKYGFSADTEYVETSNGGDLLTVKTNRNDLAHGIKSFAEVGKERGADELIKIKDKVVEYLRQILENIETYLENEEYLNPSTNTP
ncbi:MAG: MAE_28990/MAE_18760 family HEPN-like nuclease [Cyanobacteria bacterium P01_H01_bin.35]